MVESDILEIWCVNQLITFLALYIMYSPGSVESRKTDIIFGTISMHFTSLNEKAFHISYSCLSFLH